MFTNGSIQEWIETNAARTPGGSAVEGAGGVLTYDHLNRRSNQLAEYLRRSGVKPGMPVAVAMDLSVDLFIATVALTKAGAIPMAAGPRGCFEFSDRTSVGFVLTDDSHFPNPGAWSVIDVPSERGLIACMPDCNVSPSVSEVRGPSASAVSSAEPRGVSLEWPRTKSVTRS
jgi:hypothetical protein